jgi:HK97 gp10 family phage protein
MADDVVIGKEALIRKFRKMSEAAQGMTLARVVQAGAMPIANAAKINIKDQGLIRTRFLSRSIHVEVSMQGSSVAVAEVGTNAVHAAIHEFGGVVRAKTTKYLAIPVGNYRGSPRKHPGLKLRKTAGGNLIMVDGSGRVQYVLKTSVTVPAQPYMRPGFDEHKQEAIDDMGRAFAAIVTKAALEEG